MESPKILFHFTLIGFDGKVLSECEDSFNEQGTAVRHAFSLFWCNEKCGRVFIESSIGFAMTLAWGFQYDS